MASSGADALRLFEERQHEIDLVLMDVTMPHMSGIEALRRIRATGSGVPVVLSSAHRVEVITRDSLQVFRLSSKPYDVPQLLAVTSDAIASRAARGM